MLMGLTALLGKAKHYFKWALVAASLVCIVYIMHIFKENVELKKDNAILEFNLEKAVLLSRKAQEKQENFDAITKEMEELRNAEHSEEVAEYFKRAVPNDVRELLKQNSPNYSGDKL